MLFVTGYVGEGESDDLRSHELLRKPFTVGALASAVAAALSRWLANRPGAQQPRQKADPGEQRVALLPRLELDVGAGVAVDLPRDIIGAAGEGQARLGEPHDRQRLSFDAAPRQPAASRRSGRRRDAGCREPFVALAGRHRRPMPRGPCARREAPPNRSARTLAATSRAASSPSTRPGRRQQGRRRAADRIDCPLARRLVRRPHQPRRLGEPRPHRNAARLGTIEPVKSASLSTAYLAASPSCSK